MDMCTDMCMEMCMEMCTMITTTTTTIGSPQGFGIFHLSAAAAERVQLRLQLGSVHLHVTANEWHGRGQPTSLRWVVANGESPFHLDLPLPCEPEKKNELREIRRGLEGAGGGW